MPVSVAAPQAESDVPQHRERGLVPRRLIRSGQDPSDLRSVPIEFLEQPLEAIPSQHDIVVAEDDRVSFGGVDPDVALDR
jgi:hypothetical protein